MSLDSLNDEEKNILLQLSYFDLPVKNLSSFSIKDIWEEAMLVSDENGGETRRDTLTAYFNDPEKYENSNLKDIKLIGYENNNPNMNGKSETGFVGYAWEDNEGNAT